MSTAPTKNAVSLWSMRTVFGWDEFINTVQARLAEIAEVFDHNEKGKAFIYKLISLLRNTADSISAPRLAYLLARSFEDDKERGEQASKMFYDWAMDEHERRYLIAALEWYVYSIRERG
jgi:CRISPR-associated protein Csm1